MAGGSNGYRAPLARRQLTPGPISSLPGTAELPPFISFSTSYPELDSAVRGPSASYVCFWHLADVDAERATCPLSGVKRTSPIRSIMSANDP